MNKIKIFLLITFTSSTFFLSSCSNTLNSLYEVENYTLFVEYAHSPYNFPENFKFYYHGELLEISYIFYGGRVSSEVGFFIFIDGIAQPFSVTELNPYEFNYMHVLFIKSEAETIYTLNIAPTIGYYGDIFQINFVCVNFPNIDISNLSLQSMSTTISWMLEFTSDRSLDNEWQPRINMPLKEIHCITYRYIDNNFQFELIEGEKIYIDNRDDTIYLVFCGESWGDGVYRTTIFLNNLPVYFINSKNFFDHKQKTNGVKIYEFKLNERYINEINTIFVKSIDISENNSGYFRHDVYKSTTRLISSMS